MPVWSLHRLGALHALALIAFVAPGCHKRLPTGIESARASAFQELLGEPASVEAEDDVALSEAVDFAPALALDPTSQPPAESICGEWAVESRDSPPKVAGARRPVKSARVRQPEPAPAGPSPEPDEPGPDLRATPRLWLEDAELEAAGTVIHEVLVRAEQLLPVLRLRGLDAVQRKERDAGAAFIDQAREALAASEADRAAVLADKAAALIENLEFSTRR